MSDRVHELAVLLFEDYNDRRKFGDEDHEEALQNAIDWAFRNRTEDWQRADLYATMQETIPQNEMILATIEAKIREAAIV